MHFLKKDKMKTLHAAMMSKMTSGIFQQMIYEHDASKALNTDHDVVILCPETISFEHPILYKVRLPKSRILAFLTLRYQYYKWLKVQSEKYDYVLSRYSSANIFQAISSITWSNILTVHHTLEGKEKISENKIVQCLAKSIEYINSKITLSNSIGIVGVTDEIVRYELARGKIKDNSKFTHVYPNGILSGGISLITRVKQPIAHIVFVASSFHSWHGLDLLLDSVMTYTGHDKFHLHLVGKIHVKDRQTIGDDSRITIHGILREDRLRKLYMQCDLGLSSFALQRKGMHNACTLKVREYLACGLPVYCGHVDSGLPINFKFLLQGAPDINHILHYAKSMKQFSPANIRDASLQHISKIVLLSNLHAQLSELSKTSSSHSSTN